MFFRYIFINAFSFFKRFFVFNDSLYNTVIYLPIFAIFTRNVSKRSLIFISFFSLLLFFSGNINLISKFTPLFLLLLAIPMFKKVDFEYLVQKSFPFFILVSLYGIYQKLFGYTAVELNWIKSGLSFAEEGAFLWTDDIRPFSTFASMPEFTLFISIYLYYFKTKSKKLMLMFSFIMLYISGSRGVFVSVITAYTLVFVFKKFKRNQLWLSFFASLSIFLFLIFLFPFIFNTYEYSSRMLAYGSFNGRIELLTKILDISSPLSILTGLDLSSLNIDYTFDNVYVMLLAKFGLFGALYFILFFLKQDINRKSFYFLTIFLGYGFYADMIFSYYLMFLFFFGMYSQSTIKGEHKIKNRPVNKIKPSTVL